jgi:hypothetical protein
MRSPPRARGLLREGRLSGASSRARPRRPAGADARRALDASVLLMPLVGFLPGSDARIHDTVLAVADELNADGLLLRYRVDETDDGLSVSSTSVPNRGSSRQQHHPDTRVGRRHAEDSDSTSGVLCTRTWQRFPFMGE